MVTNTRVAFMTLVVSLVVLALKTKAYYESYSLGVMSDALETVVNVLAAFVALLAVKVAAAPADEDHPYGHGKFEYFSAAFEGGLIFFAGVSILFQSLQTFFYGAYELQALNGSYYLIAATFINLSVGLYLKKYGEKQNSEALLASGKHLMSDVLTTVGVLLSLVLVKVTGFIWIDVVVAVTIGLYLFKEAYSILKTTMSALLDAVDTKSLQMLVDLVNQNRVSEIIDVHQTKMIRSGSFHHIDTHVVVPEYMDVATVHRVTDLFEKTIVQQYKYDAEIAFHIDPCQRQYCGQCEMQNCPVRQNQFTGLKKMTVEQIMKGPQPS